MNKELETLLDKEYQDRMSQGEIINLDQAYGYKLGSTDAFKLSIGVVSRSVWMVQNHNTLLIHGLFSTQQKAINFAGTSVNMAITNITVDG